jgi:ABC-type Fe3+ transport system substrate-binding protein
MMEALSGSLCRKDVERGIAGEAKNVVRIVVFLANMVIAGEVPLAITNFSYKSDQLAEAGAPIRTLYLDPVIGFSSAVSVSRCATHPNAAVLFYDFMLTRGQEILAARGMVDGAPTPARRRADLHGPGPDAGQRREMDRALGKDRHPAAMNRWVATPLPPSAREPAAKRAK